MSAATSKLSDVYISAAKFFCDRGNDYDTWIALFCWVWELDREGRIVG